MISRAWTLFTLSRFTYLFFFSIETLSSSYINVGVFENYESLQFSYQTTPTQVNSSSKWLKVMWMAKSNRYEPNFAIKSNWICSYGLLVKGLMTWAVNPFSTLHLLMFVPAIAIIFKMVLVEKNNMICENKELGKSDAHLLLDTPVRVRNNGVLATCQGTDR